MNNVDEPVDVAEHESVMVGGQQKENEQNCQLERLLVHPDCTEIQVFADT